jgi:5-methyltetrahydrofolate--homocysteine methyltransferase
MHVQVVAKFCMLRQQMEKENPDDPYMCQSDFVAPKETGVQDYMGVRATHSTFSTDVSLTIVAGC